MPSHRLRRPDTHNRLACPKHWAKAPPQLQRRVVHTWRNGSRLDYLDVRDQAVAICYGCPALAACAEWAVTSGIPYGIVGGMLPDARAALRKQLGLTERMPAPEELGLLGLRARRAES